MKQSSGGVGLLTILGFVAVFFILRKFIPSFAKLFLILGCVAVFALIVLVAVAVYFALHKPKKTPAQQNSRRNGSFRLRIAQPRMKRKQRRFKGKGNHQA